MLHVEEFRVAAKGRIEIQCPHCGNLQLEPELAQSTNCRKCGGYIQLEKGRQSAAPHEAHLYPSAFQKVEDAKGRVEIQCPHCGNLQLEAESAESQRKSTSVIQELQGLFGVQRTFVARCFECAGEREVPKSATSTLCPKCGAYIDLQDYKISSIYTRSIRTGGRLIVTGKGDLIGRRTFCGSAEIQGSLRGILICTGAVRIKVKGKMSASIEAKTVYIEKKCDVEMVHPIRAESVEIEGAISGQIIATRKVVIHQTGRLTGTVSALGFTVEKGGCFLGELSIGNVMLTEGGKVG